MARWRTEQAEEFARFAVHFGRAVRKLRRDRDLSQQALADACCLTRVAITLTEKGRQTISLFHAARIAEVLGVPLAELLPEAEGE